MTLLAPLMLLGLLGLSIPVVAHLLGREPPRRVEFAALRFVRTVEPEVTQRRQIHDRWLLLLRLLLLALLVLALARPVAVSSSTVGVKGEAHDAILLVDGSGSMQLRVDGERELDRAKVRADELLSALPAGSRVGLLTTDPEGPHLEAGTDPDRISAALSDWIEEEPAPGAWSMADALADASAMLPARSGERPRVIYAIGDATKAGLGSLPELGSAGVEIVRVPVRPAFDTPPEVPEHVGIKALSWEPAPEVAPTAVRIEAVVRRYGDSGDARELQVSAALKIHGDEVGRAAVSVPPAGESVIEFTHTLDPKNVSHPTAASVELLGRARDPLPIDEARHTWLSAHQSLEVVVVNGDPSETRAHDEVFFMATALAATDTGARIRVRGLSPDQLEERVKEEGEDSLPSIDLLVLANVAAPSHEVAKRIEQRVDDGMGLWITVGDRVAAGEYNDALGRVLPLLLRGASFAGTAPGRQQARSEGMAPANLAHPMFAGFETDLDLAATKTRRMFLLEPDPQRDVDIALAFTGGAPALITREQGSGRVAVMTTTIDRDWSDLPLRPGFVPLVERAISWLGSARGKSTSDRVGVGEAKPLTTGGPLSVVMPDGTRRPIADDKDATFADTSRPGHYRAVPTKATTDTDEVNGELFVVWTDPEESNTEMLIVGRDPRTEGSAEVDVYDPRWRAILWVVLALVGFESLLRLRRPEKKWRRRSKSS